ncbi:translocation/assembly module TamB, partial [Vibrio fortis]
MDPQVCVDELTLQGLDFAFTELPPPAEEEAEPTAPLTSISTPLPITLNRVNFDDISLDILGNKIDWQRFSTAMNMKGDVLTISPTVFDDLTVKLAETEPSVEEDAKPETAKEAEAIVLPEVWIPLTVALERFDL